MANIYEVAELAGVSLATVSRVINPGAGQRNYWQQGVVVTRQMARGLQLGVEYYGQGVTTAGERPIHGVNVGAVVHLRGPFSLLGSFGQGLNRRQTIFYSSLKLDLKMKGTT